MTRRTCGPALAAAALALAMGAPAGALGLQEKLADRDRLFRRMAAVE